MKFIDKTILTLFSLIILIISIALCFYSFDWLSLDSILEKATNNKLATLGVSLILIILSIKGIFFKAKTSSKDKNSDGILLKNDNGKLVISRETIENIVNSVAKGFNGTQNVTTKLSVVNNSISVLVNLQIVGDVSISQLSIDLQNKIKEAVKKVTNLELSEVNIRVKNISDVQSRLAVNNEQPKIEPKSEQLEEE